MDRGRSPGLFCTVEDPPARPIVEIAVNNGSSDHKGVLSRSSPAKGCVSCEFLPVSPENRGSSGCHCSWFWLLPCGRSDREGETVTLVADELTWVRTGGPSGGLGYDIRIAPGRFQHHVPTDSPLRHLILLVRATDAAGNAIEQLDGQTLPDWCGVGDPNEGCYSGLPGKAFAKVLEELWTEVSPTGAYWNPTRIVSDNRIAAFATDRSTYTFAAPDDGDVTVDVALLFRRAFHDIMLWKGWDVPDIVMEEETVTLSPSP